MKALIEELAQRMDKAAETSLPLKLVINQTPFIIYYDYISRYEICLIEQLHKFVNTHKDIDEKMLKEIVRQKPIKFKPLRKIMKDIPEVLKTLRIADFDYAVSTYSHAKRWRERYRRGDLNENGYTEN